MSTHSYSSQDNVLVEPRVARSLRGRLIETLSEWRRRNRSRRELARLTELDLRDIGYPARFEEEKAKPFWRL